jgi:CBS domain-containing protein
MTPVSDYMNSKVVTRSSNATLLEIAKTMSESNISSVAIINDDKRVIGIITERDIVRNISSARPPEGMKAGTMMSSPLVSVTEDLPIEEAALFMLRRKVRHLLVETANHENVGIITVTDLARYLKQKVVIPSAITSTGNRQECSPSTLMSEVWELFF